MNNYAEIKNILSAIPEAIAYKSEHEQMSNSWKEPDDFAKSEADIIEDEKLTIKNVDITSKRSKFSFFIDGIERKQTIKIANNIPIIYGYISAAIIKRDYENKELFSTDLYQSQEFLYLPYKETGNEPDESTLPLNKKVDYKLIYNTSRKQDDNDGSYPQYPFEYSKIAHSHIQESRRKMEQELATLWLSKNQNSKDYLFIDGRLEPLSKALKDNANVIGVIKSHKTYYFPPKEQNDIFNLEKNQRTSVFQPKRFNKKTNTFQKENIYSWYIRLHEKRNNESFGLIRVEAPANDKTIEMVNEISSWILLETNPVAFPASRWDTMIYPIKYCEDYLKSKAPSKASIESLSI